MSELETGTAPAASPAEAVTPEPVETPVAETPAPKEEAASDTSLDDDLAAVYQRMNREGPPRDEQGRFQSTKPVEETHPPAAEIDGQTPEAASAETATPSIPAPHSWPAEMKAKWDTLPPDAREFIAKRESEAHQAISRMGQQVKAIQPVAETLEQYRDVFERNGMDFQGGVKALLNAQVALEQNPVLAIQHLASAYGVDLQKLYGGEDGQPSSQPQVAALQAQVANLQRQLQETSQRVMTREQREAEAQRMTLESVVADFVKDKPDFDQIEADVMALIPAIKARKPEGSPKDWLAEAYDQAQWVNPTARARRLEAERKADEARKAEEARKRAEQARKSAQINVRSQQSSSSERRSLDDELADIYRRRHG